MQEKSLQEQLKAHWDRVKSPEALALARGVRASSGIPKVTIRPTLPVHGAVVIFEDVLDVPLPESTTIEDQPR